MSRCGTMAPGIWAAKAISWWMCTPPIRSLGSDYSTGHTKRSNKWNTSASILSCGYSNVIYHPFLMVYSLYHPFMVIRGMVYYCYTHITIHIESHVYQHLRNLLLSTTHLISVDYLFTAELDQLVHRLDAGSWDHRIPGSDRPGDSKASWCLSAARCGGAGWFQVLIALRNTQNNFQKSPCN